MGEGRAQWGVVLLVVVAHGLALFAFRPSPATGRPLARGAGVIHVRQIPADSLSPSPQLAPVIPAAAGVADVPGLSGFAPPQRDRTARQDRPPGERAAEEQQATAQEDAFLDYLPRSRLSVAPAVLTSVDVGFPPEVTGIVALNVQITLFIDETGTVRRVRFDSAAIPPAFAAAVLDTFLKARFKPAEVDNAAVRSRIRLEVEFRATGTS